MNQTELEKLYSKLNKFYGTMFEDGDFGELVKLFYQAYYLGISSERQKLKRVVEGKREILPIFLMQDGVTYDWLQKDAYLLALDDILRELNKEI